MAVALYLLAMQGVIGAFDTLYYHEWRARLPARGRTAAPELLVHAARDLFYVVLFGTLPWVTWRGGWGAVLLLVITAEIVLTLWDFVVEITVRKELGDVYAGERVTHAVMGVLYGAMLACLVPTILSWLRSPTALAFSPAPIAAWLRIALSMMALGVLISGLRDLYAALGLPYGSWPWQAIERKP
ncbi:MAG: hypothetical protein O7H41_12175 [Planctomycetota bacterium]|nr:hypothetical protein [Planctomycetota bacterium]